MVTWCPAAKLLQIDGKTDGLPASEDDWILKPASADELEFASREVGATVKTLIFNPPGIVYL
jgi:hypothetical protein